MTIDLLWSYLSAKGKKEVLKYYQPSEEERKDEKSLGHILTEDEEPSSENRSIRRRSYYDRERDLW